MIRIDPSSLYSRRDLIELLAPLGIDADHFVRVLRPKRVFRLAWLGAHLLAAFEAAPALAERVDDSTADLPEAKNRGNRGRRGGRGADAPGPLDRLIADLKAQKQTACGRAS